MAITVPQSNHGGVWFSGLFGWYLQSTWILFTPNWACKLDLWQCLGLTCSGRILVWDTLFFSLISIIYTVTHLFINFYGPMIQGLETAEYLDSSAFVAFGKWKCHHCLWKSILCVSNPIFNLSKIEICVNFKRMLLHNLLQRPQYRTWERVVCTWE